jgi:hypothetical protein
MAQPLGRDPLAHVPVQHQVAEKEEAQWTRGIRSRR